MEQNLSTLPLSVKSRISCFVLAPFGIIFILCGLLTTYVNESITASSTHTEPPHILVNGSGSYLFTNTMKRASTLFADYLIHQQSNYEVDLDFKSIGSAQGQLEFLNDYNLFAATHVDVDAEESQYFLPQNVETLENVTQYVDPRAPQHLGLLMMPVLVGAVAVIYHFPESYDDSSPLILTGALLGDIFSGAVVWWNDTSIQNLNPLTPLPRKKISVIARGDSGGTNLVFTEFMSLYSKRFRESGIGVLGSPNWPRFVRTGDSATEVIYMSSAIDYSITYLENEMVLQAQLLGLHCQVASIVNSNNIGKSPSIGSLLSIMESIPVSESLKRHNYLSIIDSKNPNAYPIAFSMFALAHEHYYYFSPPPDNNYCERVKRMVYFWYFYLTSNEVGSSNANIGVTSITGSLLEYNLKVLSLVTCNKINIMKQLEKELERKKFYENYEHDIEWDVSLTVWQNDNKFQTTPVGTSLYFLFYGILILACLIPFFLNMYKLLKKGGDSHHDVGAHRSSLAIKGQYHIKNEYSNEEDDLEELEELEAKMQGKVRFTTQNILGILTQFITCFQILYLCMSSSVVIQHNIWVDIVSYIGIIPGYYEFAIILKFAVFIWIGGIFYTTYFHQVLAEHYPHKLINMTSFHAFLADFLPNFAVLLYNPSVELLAKVLDCRLNPHTWKYSNSYNETCWTKHHWIESVISLALTCTFTASVVRYSKVLKLLRKQFDFKDHEWCIYLESVAKTFIVILYFNFNDLPFLCTTFVILVGLSLCNLIGKPNYVMWFNYFRGGVYTYAALVCGTLIAFEVQVSSVDFSNRHTISDKLSLGVLVATLSLCVFTFVFISTRYRAGLSSKQMELKKEELKKFFEAFSESYRDEESQRLASAAGVVEDGITPIIGQFELNKAGLIGKSHSGSVGCLDPGSGGFSAEQWKQIDNMISVARNVGLLSKEEAKPIKLAIRSEDPIIPIIFSRSNKNLNVFVEYLKARVYTILSSNPRNSSRNGNIVNQSLQKQPSLNSVQVGRGSQIVATRITSTREIHRSPLAQNSSKRNE